MMNKFILKELAQKIAQDGGISKTQSKRLVSLLSVEDLKNLMRLIIVEEEKITAKITTSETLSRQEKKDLEKLFAGHKIIEEVDPKIGAGVKAQVYDMIYDLTVKSRIENITRELEEEL